jgi:hypothetical protein
MSQLDWIGEAPQTTRQYKVGNTRSSVAEKKAELCNQLRVLIGKTPKAWHIDTYNKVSAYKQTKAQVEKVYKSRGSSVPELEGAIRSIARFFE